MNILSYFEKNKPMESMWLLFVLFFIILLIFPMFIRVYFSFSPLKNSGLIVVKLWFIYLTYFSFQFKTNSIIIRSRKKRKQIEYKFNDPRLKYYEFFYRQIKQKVKIKSLDIYSEIGVKDAYYSAIISSIMNVFYKMFCSYVKNIKYTANIISNTKTDFNKETFLISLYGNVSISFFDIIFSLFTSFFYDESTVKSTVT